MGKGVESPLLRIAHNITNLQAEKILHATFLLEFDRLSEINIAASLILDVKTPDKFTSELRYLRNWYGNLGLFFASHHMLGNPEMTSNDISTQISRSKQIPDDQKKLFFSHYIERNFEVEPMIQETDVNSPEAEVVSRRAELKEVLKDGSIILTNPRYHTSRNPDVWNPDGFYNWGDGWETYGVGDTKIIPSQVQRSLVVVYDIPTDSVRFTELISFVNSNSPNSSVLSIKVQELFFPSKSNPPNLQLEELAKFTSLLLSFCPSNK